MWLPKRFLGHRFWFLYTQRQIFVSFRLVFNKLSFQDIDFYLLLFELTSRRLWRLLFFDIFKSQVSCRGKFSCSKVSPQEKKRNQFNILKRDFLVNYASWRCLSLKLDFVCLVFSCHWINSFNALWLFLFSRRFSFKLLLDLLTRLIVAKTLWMLLNSLKKTSKEAEILCRR